MVWFTWQELLRAGEDEGQEKGADGALPRVGAVEALVERVRTAPGAAAVDGDRRDAAIHRRVAVGGAFPQRQAIADRSRRAAGGADDRARVRGAAGRAIADDGERRAHL